MTPSGAQLAHPARHTPACARPPTLTSEVSEDGTTKSANRTRREAVRRDHQIPLRPRSGRLAGLCRAADRDRGPAAGYGPLDGHSPGRQSGASGGIGAVVGTLRVPVRCRPGARSSPVAIQRAAAAAAWQISRERCGSAAPGRRPSRPNRHLPAGGRGRRTTDRVPITPSCGFGSNRWKSCCRVHWQDCR